MPCQMMILDTQRLQWSDLCAAKIYKYEAPQPSDEIMAEILELEKELSGSLEEIFGI